MGSNSAPTIAFEWMTPIWGWINQHDQQKCWLDTLFFHDRSSFQDTGTISKSMPDFSQTFLQNLNCEKWRKRLQPHLKVTLCKCTQLLDFILQWNKRIHTSSISNSRKGALPRLGTTVPVDVFQVFIFKIWPTLTKIPPPKKQIFLPQKNTLFWSLEKLWLHFWSWCFPSPLFELFQSATSNSFNPPNLPTTCLKLPSRDPRY